MTSPPQNLTRVLILSSGVGSGHIAAAAALEQVFRAKPSVTVRNEDALTHTTRIYQVTAADAYFALVRESPWYIGWLYDFNDDPFRNERGLSLVWNLLNGQPLAALIEDYDPDIVVCTHFMPAGFAAQLLIEGRIRSQLAIVTTDYDFHRMWLSRVFSRYFVALPETRAFLAAMGVEPARITVAGIPVSPALALPIDARAVRARFDLRDDLPTLLVSAGTLGSGPAVAIVEQILAMTNPAQAVVVCGRNQPLRQAVEALVADHADRFRVIGYTDELANLMRVATLFIGKPGGLTSAECMAAGLPMVVIAPIPGQEEHNSDHLLEQGAAIRCRGLPALAFKLDQVLSDADRLAALRAGTARLARPDAAHVVVETLLQDTAAPHMVAPAERRRILDLAHGRPAPALPVDPPPAHQVALYYDDTGVAIGAVTTAQLAFLSRHLEQERPDDATYFVDAAAVEYLRNSGADAGLLAILRAALADRSQTAIRVVQPYARAGSGRIPKRKRSAGRRRISNS
jgi:processive 1,2-diacylglycerol beta-glucosyltransferase